MYQNCENKAIRFFNDRVQIRYRSTVLVDIRDAQTQQFGDTSTSRDTEHEKPAVTDFKGAVKACGNEQYRDFTSDVQSLWCKFSEKPLEKYTFLQYTCKKREGTAVAATSST